MKMLKLVHQHTKKDIVVNWDRVLFAAETESTLGETYTEVAFEGENALPVKETVDQIRELLTNDE